MAYNITDIDALSLTFNEQTAVIGFSFVVSLLSSITLAACLFGACKGLECHAPEVELPDWEENSCCIFMRYMGMKYCPKWCCMDCKRMKTEIQRMQNELYEHEMIEMREIEKREQEKREEQQKRWREEENQSLKNK